MIIFRSSGQAGRRPCDRCHTLKEGCRWPIDDTSICERCSRLKLDCQTRRPLSKRGRKAKLATGNQLALRRTRGTSSIERQHVSSSVSEDIVVARHLKNDFVPVYNQQRSLNIHQTLTLFPELNDLEIHLLDVMMHKQFEIDKYLIGPSFREQHQQAFVDHLKVAMPLLKDAFIACAIELVRNQDLRQRARAQHVGHRRAAAAIASLRLLEIHSTDDLSIVLILGVAVVTFAAHHSNGELLICRHVLNLVKSIYEGDASSIHRLGPNGISFLVCLLGTEISLCLLQCEVPTVRIRNGDLDHVVDRFIGVSGPILTILYDICELANLIHHSYKRRDNGMLTEDLQSVLDEIEEAALRWLPSSNDFLIAHFTQSEINLMLAQAKVLRCTALLTTHRLRYAFGTRDDEAAAISSIILDEIDLAVQATGKSLPFYDLAYLVACLEITNAEERNTALSKSHAIVDFSPQLRDEFQSCLVSFWAAKDNVDGLPVYWDDIGSYLKGAWRYP